MRGRAGQQGDLAGREPLPLRSRALPHHHRRAAHREPITEASKEKPYLRFLLKLDPTLVGSVMVEAGHPVPRSHAAVKAIDVSPVDAGLLDAVVRYVRLLDSPTDARFLGPLIKREIVYRLLMGEQGGRLRHIAVLGGH